MDKLHGKPNNGDILIEPEKGQRGFLCSNKEPFRCPFFGIKNNNQASEDVALDYFASILVEAFLDKKQNEYNKQSKSKEGGNICSSIHEGTGR